MHADLHTEHGEECHLWDFSSQSLNTATACTMPPNSFNSTAIAHDLSLDRTRLSTSDTRTRQIPHTPFCNADHTSHIMTTLITLPASKRPDDPHFKVLTAPTERRQNHFSTMPKKARTNLIATKNCLRKHSFKKYMPPMRDSATAQSPTTAYSQALAP